MTAGQLFDPGAYEEPPPPPRGWSPWRPLTPAEQDRGRRGVAQCRATLEAARAGGSAPNP